MNDWLDKARAGLHPWWHEAADQLLRAGWAFVKITLLGAACAWVLTAIVAVLANDPCRLSLAGSLKVGAGIGAVLFVLALAEGLRQADDKRTAERDREHDAQMQRWLDKQ